MTYPSLPASLIDPDGLFELAYTEAGFIPLLSPSPHGGLRRRTGEREDRCTRPAGDGVRNRSAASSKFQHMERGTTFRAICAGDNFRVRATGIVGTFKTETHKSRPQVRLPVFLFQSAARLADTGGLRGSVLPAFRLRFEFLGRIFRAVRTRLPVRIHSASRVCQDLPRRSVEQWFQSHSLSAASRGLAAGVYGQHTDRNEKKCPTPRRYGYVPKAG